MEETGITQRTIGLICSKLKNDLCKIVTRSQVVTKFNVTKSRLHCTYVLPEILAKLKMMNRKIQVFERLLQKEHVRSHKFCSSLTV